MSMSPNRLHTWPGRRGGKAVPYAWHPVCREYCKDHLTVATSLIHPRVVGR